MLMPSKVERHGFLHGVYPDFPSVLSFMVIIIKKKYSVKTYTQTKRKFIHAILAATHLFAIFYSSKTHTVYVDDKQSIYSEFALKAYFHEYLG